MTANEKILYDMLSRLIEWETIMGGWDAPVWREARDLRSVLAPNRAQESN